MTIRSPDPIALFAVVFCTVGLLGGVTLPLRGQSQRGRLERVGGPASLLGQRLSSIADVRALDEEDRRRWEPAYRDEEVMRGPSRRWLEADWSVRLNAVGDTVYKVTVETFLSDMAAADRLFREVNALFLGELGEAIQEDCTDFRWIGDDGDAQLRSTDVADGRHLRVVFTSAASRRFARP